MSSRRAFVVCGLIVWVLVHAAAAGAGAPTNQLRADIDELYRSVQPSPAPVTPRLSRPPADVSRIPGASPQARCPPASP